MTTTITAYEFCRGCFFHRTAHVQITRTGVRMSFEGCDHTRYDPVFLSPYTRHLPGSTR